METSYIQYIRGLIDMDLNSRMDALEQAYVDHRLGLLSSTGLKSYVADVEFINRAIHYFKANNY